MSGLDLLSGYGSDEEDTEDVIHDDNSAGRSASIGVINKTILSKGLPSALELLAKAPTAKRHISQLTPTANISNKVRRISDDRFIPPQVKLERPNVVTEDTKHR